MVKILSITFLSCIFYFNASSQKIDTLDLSPLLPNGFELNYISFSDDGSKGFFTAYQDWEKQLPFLMTIGKDTVVKQLSALDTIYNGAISPSGNQIIYTIRDGDRTTIHLTKRTSSGWSRPINLSASSNVAGGYFFWNSETEIYFYIPENNGDLVRGVLIEGQLKIEESFDSLNTNHTEFSPYVSPQKEFLIFTRYAENDPSQQGFMISHNNGSSNRPIWSTAKKVKGLPYGWGAFVANDGYFYFTDGVNILRIRLASLQLKY